MPDGVRNVLVFMSDQHRASVNGWMGDPWAHTPHLDALARRGIAFDRAYTTSPVCVPARYSLLTGRRPYLRGGVGNQEGDTSSDPTFAHLAKEAGFATGAVGKMHFHGADQHRGFDVRWDLEDYYALEPEACGDTASGMAAPGRYGTYAPGIEGSHPDGPNPMKVHDGNYDAGPSPFPAERHIESHVTRQALRFLEAHRHDRWVLWCSYFKPHAPYTPPVEEWERFAAAPLPVPAVEAEELAALPAHLRELRRSSGMDTLDEPAIRRRIAGYYGSVSFVDRQIGEVLGALEALGLAEETLVVYTSDHGDMVGAHGLFAKFNFYEESWRVPLLLSHPAFRGTARRAAGLASLTDVLPTLCESAGIPAPSEIDGVSLLPLISGERETVRDHVTGRLRMRAGEHTAACDGRWKLARYPDVEQLFDLSADPAERHNLIDIHPAQASRLRRLLGHGGRAML